MGDRYNGQTKRQKMWRGEEEKWKRKKGKREEKKRRANGREEARLFKRAPGWIMKSRRRTTLPVSLGVKRALPFGWC